MSLLLAECVSCRARTQMVTGGFVDITPRLRPGEKWDEVLHDPGRSAWPSRVTLLQCPACREAVVVRQFANVDSKGGLAEPYRLWPDPDRPGFTTASIPRMVHTSLQQARKCLSAGIYDACVLMSGRALEAVARHFHTGRDELMLGKGLEALHAQKVIDDRLLAWGRELHQYRNLAAHPDNRTVSRAEAQDLFDFAWAIYDYVFILKAKHDAFLGRKAAKISQPRPEEKSRTRKKS